MKIVAGTKWIDGFLDYYRRPSEYRVQVLAWKNLEKLEDLYFVRPKKLRVVWNYFLEIGVRETLRKIKSRTKERYRNEKLVSLGLGRVVESANELQFPIGQIVAFLAPCHPKCVERIVLPADLMLPMDQEEIPNFKSPTRAIYFNSIKDDKKPRDRWWAPISGWSGYSGLSLSPDLCRHILTKVKETICQTNWQEAELLYTNENSVVTETKGEKLTAHSGKLKNSVLFGYGNYAKIIILPNIQPYLHVNCIHEVDPTQIPLETNTDKQWDTSPNCRVEEDYDVLLIAGFHHTHAPLAIQTLERGRDAVVEKPIVTTEHQLAELLCTMEKSKGRLFCCFHKRYLPFNDLVIKDMGLEKGDPVSYHCIGCTPHITFQTRENDG